MGTEISLTFAGATLAWSKNHRGMDHGPLFQECDRRAYLEEDEGYTPPDDVYPMAFVRDLGSLKPRLELLGFTMERIQADYDALRHEWIDIRTDDGEAIGDKIPPTFDEYRDLATKHPIADLDSTYHSIGAREHASGRFATFEDLIDRLPRDYASEVWDYCERDYLVSAVNILHPYATLRILAENSENHDSDVVWDYGPLVSNGWENVEAFIAGARREETFLIATEGTSDLRILRQGLELLRPQIVDFFRFIDVEERHPFSGTGNLVKFAEGLAKIDVHNQVVFVFDNDAEGLDAHEKVLRLNLPANMSTMVLPDLEDFKSFPCRGPQGEHEADINGRGAAIECYLDHALHDYPPPRVVWTNLKEPAGVYQGSLEFKDSYTKAFLSLRKHTLESGNYDFTRIEAVLDRLTAECIRVASAQPSSIDR
ncbi:HEPN/Toprim-associated domain-containing protein [Citromicrobium bathyomarinum]|uniref:HEPN/Toprim-associated domain-containing protein n=1 Tax=Citromicrobium bathyomarinum TaxID=72174 RepID=UPI00315A0D0C